jgi:hypothetical protein
MNGTCSIIERARQIEKKRRKMHEKFGGKPLGKRLLLQHATVASSC